MHENVYREGSIVVIMVATTLDHPDARSLLFARLNSLDLQSLFFAPAKLIGDTSKISNIISRPVKEKWNEIAILIDFNQHRNFVHDRLWWRVDERSITSKYR